MLNVHTNYRLKKHILELLELLITKHSYQALKSTSLKTMKLEFIIVVIHEVEPRSNQQDEELLQTVRLTIINHGLRKI